MGKVAYHLALPEELRLIHNTFYVSQLRKCLANKTATVPFNDTQVNDKLNYVEKPVSILERKMKTLHNKETRIVKVPWQHRRESEWTWDPKGRNEKKLRYII